MGCMQKKGIKISVIQCSSDKGSETNSGQGLKQETGLIFTEIILHFWADWSFSRFCISATL